MSTETWPFFSQAPDPAGITRSWTGGLLRSGRFGSLGPGIVEMGDHFGLSLESGTGSYLNRRSDTHRHADAAMVGRAFLDRPGDRLHVTIEGESRWLQVMLPRDLLDRILLEDHDEAAGGSAIRPVRGSVDTALLSLVGRALLTKDEGRDLAIRAIVGHLVETYGDRRAARRNRGLSPARLRRVRDLVSSRIADVSLAAMAAEAGLSIYHFAREFRHETGQTPWDYVVERRVWLAVGLLAGGFGAMEEIASRAGFAHASHMGRSFRKVLGAPPRVVRNRLLP